MIKVGDKAPSFKGVIESGKEVSLGDYTGKKLVIFFYPADMTPGCTAEACNLRDHYAELKDAGYELLGVSTDNESKHQKFIAKYELPFNLIADTDKTIVKSFGVYGPKSFMGRIFEGTHRKTFVIDENGVVERIIEKVKTKDHAAQILESVAS